MSTVQHAVKGSCFWSTLCYFILRTWTCLHDLTINILLYSLSLSFFWQWAAFLLLLPKCLPGEILACHNYNLRATDVIHFYHPPPWSRLWTHRDDLYIKVRVPDSSLGRGGENKTEGQSQFVVSTSTVFCTWLPRSLNHFLRLYFFVCFFCSEFFNSIYAF